MGGLIVFILLVVGGFLAWALYTPPIVREAQKKQQMRADEVNNAIRRAKEERQGIVILSLLLGHPDTIFYQDGTRRNYIAVGPNGVSGWTIEIQIINSCGKAIKYCKFNIRLLNAVGDPAECTIQNRSEFKLSGTGPVAHGDTATWRWEDFCYSNDLKMVKIDSIDVDYIDGTEENIANDKIVWRT